MAILPEATATRTLSDLDFLVSEDLVPLACFLLGESYPDHNIEMALSWAARYSTVECCPFVDSWDKERAEATLPRCPESDWADDGFDVYEEGGEGEAAGVPPFIPVLKATSPGNGTWLYQVSESGDRVLSKEGLARTRCLTLLAARG